MFMFIQVLDNGGGGWIAEGAERQILKFVVPRSPEMAFLDSSVPLMLDLCYL
jgi:hypothetical protein